ncbi:sporulation protein [Allokutzneria albata]|uniref:Sporulation-control protein n=1 Tax=Allokutzneria albata TaxID=211114 RepID=A0A1H0A845_ALLAB|nr:sporulation protein [Allokutzneria albata]SDN28936.1 sporulation-control protein [Allokutzneria albata]
MVFKKLLGALGIGGPSVDTVLFDPNTRPGGVLSGEVRIQGGDHDVNIEFVALGLVTRVEAEHGDHERSVNAEFHRIGVEGAFRLAAKESRNIPFQFPVPWETPVTDVYGQRLPGMTIGLRTELAVAGAVDKGDLDPVFVHPLPAQERVLDAFGQLGFRFRSADVEQGHIAGLHQQLPFFQEIEFLPPHQFAGRINEVELTFVADPHGMAVVLEADKRGGFFSSGHDAFGRFQLSHEDSMSADWAGMIDNWLHEVSSRRQSHHGHHGGHHGYHGGHHDGGGMGVGGIVAAGAAGVVGGMVLGEVFDEVGDAFFGDDEG